MRREQDKKGWQDAGQLSTMSVEGESRLSKNRKKKRWRDKDKGREYFPRIKDNSNNQSTNLFRSVMEKHQ